MLDSFAGRNFCLIGQVVGKLVLIQIFLNLLHPYLGEKSCYLPPPYIQKIIPPPLDAQRHCLLGTVPEPVPVFLQDTFRLSVFS